ncbi:MAG TPA: 3-oxoadipate enol-lactonase [Nocardioidaceae bacterium]|nr:3-oxoadipate enol-lactonase [Nocardioidaceae bacterium]
MSTQTVELKHYEQGPAEAPAVMLAPSLGTTLAMWDGLARALATSYRVVRFDTRGHGASPVPAGPYTLGDLAEDVVALADSLAIDRFAFVGLSLGGAVGQVLALAHPDRLSALVLCCTGPSFGEPSTWCERAAQVRAEGMGFLVEPTKDRWFTRGFRESHPEEVAGLIEMIATSNPAGYAACCDALAGFDVTSRLGEISAPTRVIAGAEDPVSPPSVARILVDAIPDADLVVLDDASHIANVQQPVAFDQAVLEHLEKHL